MSTNRGNGVHRARATEQSLGALAKAHWLTPAGMAGMDHTGKAGAGGEFAQQATRWQSPQTSDANGPRVPDGKRSLGLNTGAAQFHANFAAMNSLSTLAATDAPTAKEKGSTTMAAWPTPAARDAKGPNSEVHVTTNRTGRMHMDQLANFVAFSPLVQPIPDGQTSSPETPSSRRHLNPLFGSWLMGWPSTWTIAEPHASSALATALWRSQLRQQLSCFFDGLDS